MTEQAALGDSFAGSFRQFEPPPGNNPMLVMQLNFEPAEPRSWTVHGQAELLDGPTRLEFPMNGEFAPAPGSEQFPPVYSLRLNSDFPDGNLGISLSVTLTTDAFLRSETIDKAIRFTGEYTWSQGQPTTVANAQFAATGTIVGHP